MTKKKTCQHCGKEYEVCLGCSEAHFFSWRQVACSHECYIEIEKIAMGIKEEKIQEAVGDQDSIDIVAVVDDIIIDQSTHKRNK